MWQLKRVHLQRVGHGDARFDPLTFDLVDEDGQPTDTVLWLENGGGKTSLLSLIFAVLAPASSDFLGKKHGRALGDYVGSGDVGHVVLEWSQAGGGLPGVSPSERLVTGMVLEWAELRRRDDNPKALSRLTYGFRAGGWLEAAELPFAGPSGAPSRASAFAEDLVRLLDRVPQAQLHRPSSNQGEWRTWLDVHGLDPEAFAYQLGMNADEGAIADEFAFDDGDAFVRWALKLAADPRLATSLVSALDATRTKLEALPGYRLEMELCDGAAGLLGKLSEAHTVLDGAREHLDSERRSAREMAYALQVAAGDAEAARERARGDAAGQQEAGRKVRALAEQARRAERRYLQLAAEASLRDAETELNELSEAAVEADLVRTAWRVADTMAKLAGVQVRQREVDGQLARFEEGLAPLKSQIAAAERTVAARVAHLRAAVTADRQAATNETSQLKAAAAADRTLRTDLEAQAERALRRESAAQSQLDALEAERASLVTDGLLDTDVDPQAAADQAARAAETAETALATASAAVASAQEQSAADQSLVTERQGLLADATSAQRDAVSDHQRMRTQAAPLERDPTVVATAGHDPALLWATPGLAAQLTDDAGRYRRDAVDASITSMSRKRVSDSITAGGTFPPPPDTAAALATLSDVGFAAVDGFTYLTDALDATSAAAVVEHAPASASGVVLTDGTDPAEAVAALRVAGFVPELPLTVTSAAALLDPTSVEGTAVVACSDAVYDRDAATALLAELGPTIERDRKAIEQAQRAATDRDEAAARLKALLDTWPDDVTVGRTLADANTAVEEADDRLTEAAEKRDDAEADLQEQVEREADTKGTLDERRAVAAQLTPFARRYAATGTLAGEVTAAAGELTGLRTRLSDLDARAEARELVANQLAERRSRLDEKADRLANELGQLGVEPADASQVPDPGGELNELSEAVRRLRGQLATQRSESALADQSERLRDEVAALVTVTDGAEAQVVARAEQLLASPDSTDPAARRSAAERADREHTRAVEARGGAATRRDDARDRLKAARTHDGTLPDGAPVPDGADDLAALAAEQAALLESNQVARTAHENRANELEVEAQAHEARRVRLADAMSDLVADAGDVQAGSFHLDPDADPVAEAREVRRSLRQLADHVGHAREVRSDAHQAVTRFVLDEQFGSLVKGDGPTSNIVDRLTIDDVEAAGSDAASLASELDGRASTLQADIDDIDVHRRILVEQLAGAAVDALGLLDDIEKRSRMPEGLGDWSNRRFLEISHADVPDDAGALNDRMGRVVASVVDGTGKLDGPSLLFAAVRAAVDEQPFTVRMLKPHMNLRYDRVDISDLAGFSGGQKVSSAIALFATMINMRATARGHAAYRTTLLLDNPFGKSSADTFVQLQRRVAERLGLQLVFTTAVKDLGALSHFPRVVRLAHRQNRRTSEQHVVVSEVVGLAMTSRPIPNAEADTDGDDGTDGGTT